MSRVRILNLPRDCTENQLRRHLLTSLPPSAPHLEITDCMIKRSSSSDRKERGGIVRMAFVGFRNSASGHFVVRHFHGTYLGSAKLHVEIAKGLAEVGITTNMRKRMEKTDSTADLSKKKGREENSHIPTVEKRPRDSKEMNSAHRHGEAGATEEGGIEDLDSQRKKERKEAFITQRTKATSGPTWATEVLVPEISGTRDTHSDENDVKPELMSVDDIRLNDDTMAGTEEAEQRALARQQALGAVSDFDFLASIQVKSNTASTEDTMRRSDTHNIKQIGDKSGDTNDNEGEEDENDDERVENVEKSFTKVDQQSSSGLTNDELVIVQESRRIRMGNIPFIATEDDVKQFASSLVGPVEAVHIPLTRDTKQSKGAAFVKFARTEDAVEALKKCKGAIFMGRLLRISAAEDDPYTKKLEENTAVTMTTSVEGGGLAGCSDYKRGKDLERKKESGTMSWNTMYMNSHAAVEAVAKRIGVRTEDVVSANARGAAVRAAIAEAYLTTEIQQVLSDEGIDFGLLESAQQNILKARSNTTILVKNIQADTPDDVTQLTKMFLRYGALEATAFPSAGTFALFRFAHPQDARVAFQRLAYKVFKTSPLFLEWAPVGVIRDDDDDDNDGDDNNGKENPKHEGVEGFSREKNEGAIKWADEDDDNDEMEKRKRAAFAPVLTLFITNIPFHATEEQFREFMLDACARLAKAPDTHMERLAFDKDKGRVFLTLRDQHTFAYVQKRLNGKNFAGRTLACVPSKQTAAALEEAQRAPTRSDAQRVEEMDEDNVVKNASVVARRGGAQTQKKGVPAGCDPLKLVVKNVPFEATEKDVRDLFSAFSEVRSVRLPRKSHQFTTHRENNHRGFAFVEFLSEEEARRAMETLKATHLYGRHLVLQYAKLDDQ